jgi:hypothetical protein
MYVKQNILFLNNLFGETYWHGDLAHFHRLMSDGALAIMYRYILAGNLAFFYC